MPRVAHEGFGDDLQCDIAPKLRIARPIHFAHAAGADRGGDFIYGPSRVPAASDTGTPLGLYGDAA